MKTAKDANLYMVEWMARLYRDQGAALAEFTEPRISIISAYCAGDVKTQFKNRLRDIYDAGVRIQISPMSVVYFRISPAPDGATESYVGWTREAFDKIITNGLQKSEPKICDGCDSHEATVNSYNQIMDQWKDHAGFIATIELNQENGSFSEARAFNDWIESLVFQNENILDANKKMTTGEGIKEML